MSHSRLSGMHICKDRMVSLDEFKASLATPSFAFLNLALLATHSR
jgi:hypothetical protein